MQKETGARLAEQREDAFDDVGGGVAGNLDHIFARVRAGGAKDAHQHFVHQVICIIDFSEMKAVARRFGQRAFAQADDLVGYRQAVGAADAKERNGPRPGKGGRGANRCMVLKTHCKLRMAVRKPNNRCDSPWG